jgi:hypothetical protein
VPVRAVLPLGSLGFQREQFEFSLHKVVCATQSLDVIPTELSRIDSGREQEGSGEVSVWEATSYAPYGLHKRQQ